MLAYYLGQKKTNLYMEVINIPVTVKANQHPSSAIYFLWETSIRGSFYDYSFSEWGEVG